MNADLFQRVAEVFESVRTLRDDERRRALDDACAGDVTLRTEVEALLNEHERSTGALDRPLSASALAAAVSEAAEVAAAPAPDVPPVERVGRYRLIRKIGEGGMGVVYLAEQDQPRRTVCVKIIRAPLAGARALRRFEHEAEILGRLQHPGIAQIFEAGTADTGSMRQPFFAMEYVDGASLLDYARLNRLDTRARLTLIMRVCDAVQHAHQRGVIHRDLKPGNIMVDEHGQPKVLDFGVARSVIEDESATLRTGSGELIGTLPYMSPEQVERGEDVDTRADVYALGVVCYQLLCGRLPYDVQGRSIPDIARIIRDQTPRPLGAVDRAFRGDLETVVATALAKEPERRYRSPARFADDIGHVLAEAPIEARPASTFYQVRMFARRNRPLVAALGAVVIALVVGAVGMLVFGVGQARARAEAERQTEIARAVNDFLIEGVLEGADWWESANHDKTLREAVADAARAIPTRFSDQPHVEGAVRLTLARTLRHLGDARGARVHVERALELFRGPARSEADEAAAMVELATILSSLGEYPESEAVHLDALAMQRRLLDPDDPDLIKTATRMAVIHIAKGEYDAAEPLLRQTLAAGARADRPQDIAAGTHWLGYLLAATGREAEAEAICREALELRRAVFVAEHPAVANSMINLGRVLTALERFEEAEALLRGALDMRRRHLVPEHGLIATGMDELAAMLTARGAYEEAGTLLDEVVDMRRRIKPGHVDCSISLYHRGVLRLRTGNGAAAEADLREALVIQERELNPGNPYVADTQIALGGRLIESGRAEEAEPLLRAALATRVATLVPGAMQSAVAQRRLAVCLVAQSRYQDAEQLLLDALEIIEAHRGPDHTETQFTRALAAAMYEGWGKPERARELR